MSEEMDGLICRLREAFAEPPTDEQVRGQGFKFYRAHWLKWWPEGLPKPALLTDGSPTGYVSRRDIFDRARTVATEADATELYVLMGSWGAGPMARPLYRVAKALQQHDAPAALLRSYQAARDVDPVEAYRRLKTTGEDRIKFLGAAFFTKWLYFSGYDALAYGGQPLILDARVAASLGWRSSGWSSAEYGEYLDIAAWLRELWCPDRPLHVIEYALFQLDRSSPPGVD